jgi:hypothetical protein
MPWSWAAVREDETGLFESRTILLSTPSTDGVNANPRPSRLKEL